MANDTQYQPRYLTVYEASQISGKTEEEIKQAIQATLPDDSPLPATQIDEDIFLIQFDVLLSWAGLASNQYLN